MMKEILTMNKEMIFNYSLLSFNRSNKDKVVSFEMDLLERGISKGGLKVYDKINNSNRITILYERLDWDSDFFKQNTIKIKHIFYTQPDISSIRSAVKDFLTSSFEKKSHILMEVPSKDIIIIQVLTSLGLYMNESRINYYLNIVDYDWERYKTRIADFNDIDNLSKVSAEMKNPYDRFHSDPFYSPEKAERFLATYVEESIKGFADIVIVPDEDGLPSDSFYAARYQQQSWEAMGMKASKIVLSAVSNATNKGWFLKLNSEMIYRLKKIGAEYVYFQTATTNNAVIHTNEKLGYKIGSVSHYFSYLTDGETGLN